MGILDIRTPARKDISVTEGDGVRVVVRFKASDGTPEDVSAYDLTEAPIIDTDIGVVLDNWTVDMSNAAQGEIVLTLTVTQTSALCPCSAAWYLQLIDSADPDTLSRTVLEGDFTVRKRRGFGE